MSGGRDAETRSALSPRPLTSLVGSLRVALCAVTPTCLLCSRSRSRSARSAAKKARETWMLDAKEDNPKHAEEEADEYVDEDEDSQ